jgi:hypothetical protein
MQQTNEISTFKAEEDLIDSIFFGDPPPPTLLQRTLRLVTFPLRRPFTTFFIIYLIIIFLT